VGSKIVIAILPEGILEIGSEKHKCLAGVWLERAGLEFRDMGSGIRDQEAESCRAMGASLTVLL
jgi:hypothetical protein